MLTLNVRDTKMNEELLSFPQKPSRYRHYLWKTPVPHITYSHGTKVVLEVRVTVHSCLWWTGWENQTIVYWSQLLTFRSDSWDLLFMAVLSDNIVKFLKSAWLEYLYHMDWWAIQKQGGFVPKRQLLSTYQHAPKITIVISSSNFHFGC